MSVLWYPNVKQAPLQGLNGMWGGVGSNIVSGGGDLGQGTIQQLYDATNAPGLQNVVMDNGTTKSMNFDRYNSKGWVEIVFMANVPYGYHQSADFYSGSGPYKFNTKNETGGSGSAGRLDYTEDGSQIALGTLLATTDLLVTSKSSASLAQISPATGFNQSSILPLQASADILGTQAATVKTAYLNYFRVTRDGFSHGYNQPSSTNNFNAYWQKSPSPFGFAGLLHHRGGSSQLDHWMFADGQSQTPSTYHPNIGFRGDSESAPYSGKNVGSWTSDTGTKGSDCLMDASNVFSIWVTDM